MYPGPKIKKANFNTCKSLVKQSFLKVSVNEKFLCVVYPPTLRVYYTIEIMKLSKLFFGSFFILWPKIH